MYLQQHQKPPCFGDAWDPNEPECTGGRDPSYIHPKNGTNYREQCSFYHSCGRQVQLKKASANVGNTVSTHSLIRNRPTQSTTNTANTATTAKNNDAVDALLKALGAQPDKNPVVDQLLAVLRAATPGHHQMMPVNFEVPTYLTVTEPHGSGPIWIRLGREVMRSAMKGVGHQFSSFWDHNTFGKK